MPMQNPSPINRIPSPACDVSMLWLLVSAVSTTEIQTEEAVALKGAEAVTASQQAAQSCNTSPGGRGGAPLAPLVPGRLEHSFWCCLCIDVKYSRLNWASFENPSCP